MTPFELLAILVTLAAVLSWVNYRYVKLPPTIGLMVLALLGSVLLVGLGSAGVGLVAPLERALEAVDFDAALLNGMLGALLFAGALHLNVNDLLEQKWIITALATVGVVVSTAVIGVMSSVVFGWLGLNVPFVYCLLFGALISPTDPIAVGAILKRAGVPRSLLVKITGESLFNDGFGVVVFLIILGLATGGHGASVAEAAELFLVEVAGGLVYGGVVGWVTYRLLRSVDNYQVEILLTLALVTGGYALAHALHLSGPLAMVVAGLLIGNRGRALAMSQHTQERLDQFWELVDEFLNAVLFVLIGVEVVVLELSWPALVAGLAAIPLVLGARWVAVVLPVSVLRRIRRFSPHAVKILTWSGLRGGISVALALSLPAGEPRSALLVVTYVVVCFSIVVQGLTVGPLARRLSDAPR